MLKIWFGREQEPERVATERPGKVDLELRTFGDSHRLLIIGTLFAAGWLLYLLGPVLTPFFLACLFAYLGDPVADRLEKLGLKRGLAVIIVFAALILFGVLLLVFLVPILEQQLETLIGNVPMALDWLQRQILPLLTRWHIAPEHSFDADAIRAVVVGHWQELAGYLKDIIGRLTLSGQMVLEWLLNLVLVPVLTFYLLRDWDLLLSHLRHLIPRRFEPKVAGLALECNEVLAGFLRGQLLVMLALSGIYILGLWLIGLNVAFSVGLLAGLVSFVPYLGFAVGIAVAGVAAIVQYHSLMAVFYVALVFTAAEAIQGFLLSPLLVGERIGLHPVSVIFAILAGGQLFGFVGVLIGLPVAAVIVVLLRHSRDAYLRSELYTP
jgi:predicted PurR-regulated permease PerM